MKRVPAAGPKTVETLSDVPRDAGRLKENDVARTACLRFLELWQRIHEFDHRQSLSVAKQEGHSLAEQTRPVLNHYVPRACRHHDSAPVMSRLETECFGRVNTPLTYAATLRGPR